MTRGQRRPLTTCTERGRARLRRRLSPARLAALAGLAALLVLALASPAAASATLEQTSPTPGAVLTTPPTRISLRFGDTVSVAGDAVRLFDVNGHRIATGPVQHPTSDTVTVPLLGRLADGAYEVTWRVVSADTNPAQGSFTFQVGLVANATAPNVTTLAQSLAHQQRGSAAVGVANGVVRGALYTGIALLIGVVAFTMLVWPESRRSRRTAQLAWAGWGLTLAATLLLLPVQGIYGAGAGFGSLAHLHLLRQVLGTQFGHLSIVRLVLLAGAAPLLRRFLRPGADVAVAPGELAAAGGLAVVLALTVALSGHAFTSLDSGLAVPSDVVHILAMSAWLGGLAVLAYAVFPGRSVDELRDAVPRFLRVAAICVVVLLVTGAFQAWALVGSVHALRTTTYGKILSVKLVAVLTLIVVTAFSRQIVGYLFPAGADEAEARRVPLVAGGADDDPPSPNGSDAEELDDEDWELDEEYELRRLRRSVVAEVVLALVAIAVTVLLVNATPARAAAAKQGTGVASVTLKSPRVWIDFYVIPGIAPSANDVHVTAILPSGAPENLNGLTATLRFPSRHTAPLVIPMRHLGPGHYLSPGFTIPYAGTWQVTTNVLLTDNTPVHLTDTITFP